MLTSVCRTRSISRWRLAAPKQVAEAQGIFFLPSGGAVEADQLGAIAGGIFTEAAHGDHRIEQRHVGPVRQGGGLLSGADDPHLLAEGTGKLVDDDRHQRVGNILGEL